MKDVIPTPLDAQGEALRRLLTADLDKCHCTEEVFEGKPDDDPYLVLVEDTFEVWGRCSRLHIPLRPEPLTTKDFERAFIRAAEVVGDHTLYEKGLVVATSISPRRGPNPTGRLEIEGLPHPIVIAEPQYLGVWIQNYSNHGMFLHLDAVSKTIFD